MKIGLGLPVTRPELLLEWARSADAGPFSALGLLDRLAWRNPEPLVTLSVLAGATTRIRLQTEVLLVPLRQPALLASQVATLDRLCGGRFTLGVGIGGRADDEDTAGVGHTGRGTRMDAALTELRARWTDESVGPRPVRDGGPEILVGAFHPAALSRVARFGDGLLCAADPGWAGDIVETVHRQWIEHGRTGTPRNVGQLNVDLGPPDVVDEARRAIGDYYAFLGDTTRPGLRTTPADIRTAIHAFEGLGFDEVVLYCWAYDPAQVERIADAVAK